MGLKKELSDLEYRIRAVHEELARDDLSSEARKNYENQVAAMQDYANVLRTRIARGED